MAKKKKNAVKPAPVNNQKETKVDNNVEQFVVETPVAETTEVEEIKPAEQPAEVVDTEKVDTTADKTKKGKKDTAKTEIVIPETVSSIAKTLSKDLNKSKISTDSKVQLATLMQRRYIDNDTAKTTYGETFINEMDGAIDALTVMALLEIRDEAVERGADMNIVLKNGNTLLQLDKACEMFGITLPKVKALPGSDGQQSLNFKDAEVAPEIEKIVKDERTAKRDYIENAIPELDPSKMTDEHQLTEAIQYKMRSKQNIIASLIDTIEWLRAYRNFKATTAEQKLAFEDYSVGDWVKEILSITKPTLLMCGIGRAVYLNTIQDKTPLGAHCIIHKHVMDKNGKAIFNDEQIASLLIALLKANASFAISSDPEKYKGKTISDDNALRTVMSGSPSLVDSIMSQKEPLDKKLYSMVRKNYYGEAEPTAELTDKVRNKIGSLLNLYLPIMERMTEFTNDNVEITEYPVNNEKKK